MSNFEIYTSCALKNISDLEEEDYPIGLLIPENGLRPIKVYFMHYNDFETASAAWKRRCERIDFNNILFIWEFYDEYYDIEMLQQFDSKPSISSTSVKKNPANTQGRR